MFPNYTKIHIYCPVRVTSLLVLDDISYFLHTFVSFFTANETYLSFYHSYTCFSFSLDSSDYSLKYIRGTLFDKSMKFDPPAYIVARQPPKIGKPRFSVYCCVSLSFGVFYSLSSLKYSCRLNSHSLLTGKAGLVFHSSLNQRCHVYRSVTEERERNAETTE